MLASKMQTFTEVRPELGPPGPLANPVMELLLPPATTLKCEVLV